MSALVRAHALARPITDTQFHHFHYGTSKWIQSNLQATQILDKNHIFFLSLSLLLETNFKSLLLYLCNGQNSISCERREKECVSERVYENKIVFTSATVVATVFASRMAIPFIRIISSQRKHIASKTHKIKTFLCYSIHVIQREYSELNHLRNIRRSVRFLWN